MGLSNRSDGNAGYKHADPDAASGFADKTNTLLNLQKQYDLSFTIDIVIEVENNQPPVMCLQGFILEFAAALHARIDMDMYILEAEQ